MEVGGSGGAVCYLSEKELPVPSGNPETAPPMALQPNNCITGGISQGESKA